MEQNYYPISEFHLFEKLIYDFEKCLENDYPIFEEVSECPDMMTIMDVLSAIGAFNENYMIAEKTENQFSHWRKEGVTEEQDLKITGLQERLKAGLVINKKILSFLNA